MAFANYNCRDITHIRSTEIKVVIHMQDANGDYVAPDTDAIAKLEVWKNSTKLTSPAGYSFTESALTSQAKMLTITLASAPLISDHITIIASYKFSGTDKTQRINVTFSPSKEDNADQVWDEAMSGHTSNGSYGSHVVRSANQNQNTVSITGSQHIAADIHELQPAVITSADFDANAINANALATDAVTEIANGVWNETIAGNNTAGTFGYVVQNQGTLVAGTIADAVWDESLSGHTNSTQFGGKLQDIYALVDSANITTASPNVGNGTLTIYADRNYDGTAHPLISFTVTKDYTNADEVKLFITADDDTTSIYKEVVATVASTTSITIDLDTNTFDQTIVYDGTPPVKELRYSLVADWNSSYETIATGLTYVYQQPPY